MTEVVAWPLCWPQGWPRTESYAREHGRFHKIQRTSQSRADGTTYISEHKQDLSIADACQRIVKSLSTMGVADSDIIVSTNVRPRLDGMPRSNAGAVDDAGVAAYWKRNGKQQCIAVDRYHRVADNLAAVAATLDAMRAIDRHGGAQILDRAFTGFVALPAPEQPWQVLGLTSHATRGEIEDAHRRLAMEHHPDRGGDAEKMARINAARDQLLSN